MTGAAPPVPETTLAEDLRALLRCPRELWLVYLATFFEFVGVFSFQSADTLWLSGDYDMGDERAGWWAAAFSILVSVFLFTVGSIADVVGVRRMLIASFCLAAVTRLAMALAPTAMAAVASMLVFALAYATTQPVLQTAIQRTTTKRTRAFAFSFWYVSLNVGGVLSGLVIDGMRERFLDPATQKLARRTVELPLLGARSFSANGAIMAVGFASALLGVLVVLATRRDFEHRRDPGEGAHEEERGKASSFAALRDVLADRAFWRFMLLLLFLCLVRMMFQHMALTWPKYVTREQGEAFPYGKVGAINSLLILGLAPLGTAITRRKKPFDVLLTGALISSLSPFVLCFGSAMPFQITSIVVLTIGEALWSPRLYEYNVAIAPRGREATYVSLAALPYFLAKLLVSPSSGYLLAAFCPEHGPRRPAILWAIIGASTMVGPIGIWLCRGWLQQTEVVRSGEQDGA